MNEVRCTKCNKKLGESPNDFKYDSASCEKDKIIYKTKCTRCNTDIIIIFKY
jgi:phage FluMu protein Com